MLFSIIVPVYNMELYLDKCLQSILHQTFADFEVILIKGETPGTFLFCQLFECPLVPTVHW